MDGLTHILESQFGLDEIGVVQVNKTAKYCAALKIDLLYTSPDKSTKETTKIIADKLNLKIIENRKLLERDWGDWNGKPWEEIKAILLTKTIKERFEFIPPGGESWKQMDSRLRQFLDEVTNTGKDVIGIVTHGGALRGLMPILSGKGLSEGIKYNFGNASITIFDYRHGQYKEIFINRTEHLNS